MIHFEVLQTPDNYAKSVFKFYKNTVYIGRKNGDLLIQDNSLAPSQIMLEIINNELILHPQKGVEFFLINGKRATTIRKLRIKDQVTIGQTVLRILSYEETPVTNKKTLLEDKLNRLVENNSPRLSLIEALMKMAK